MATPENAVKKQIDALLKKYEFVTVPGRSENYKIMWWYKPQSGTYGRAGIPDYIGCFNGRLFAIEAKAANGKLTVLQENALEQIRRAGGRVFVVWGQPNTKGTLYQPDHHSLALWLQEETAAFKARVIFGVEKNTPPPPDSEYWAAVAKSVGNSV